MFKTIPGNILRSNIQTTEQLQEQEEGTIFFLF